MESGWNQLLNMSTADIHRAARDLSLPPSLQVYARVLSSFLQGDTENLAKICAALEPDEPTREIAFLRLAIREANVKSKSLYALADRELPGVLDGEKYFCLAMAWERLENHEQSMRMFTRAAELYARYGVNGKALRSRFNAIAADSRLHPHKNFVGEYQSVIADAVRLGDRAFAGIARVMLAREYQVVGLHEKAFAMAEEGLADLESERGAIHYFHALLQKAHILFDLGRRGEMRELLQECELANFAEIRAARALLAAAIDPGAVWDKSLEKDLQPTWKNRVPILLANRKVIEGEGAATELERALLRLAYNGPVEKWDLIAKLYPGEDDSLALENRFKNLIARVRKKHPGVLQCEGSRYFLAKMPEKERTL